MFSHLFDSLINLLFPKVCSGCKDFLLEFENVICTHCRHEIPLTNFHLNPENEGYQKFYGRIPVEFVSSFVYFHKKGIVQEMIHGLKYRGREEVGQILGNWYAEDLKKLAVMETVDFIIPVPLHKKRLRQRGYNQVTTFGKALSEQLEIEYNETILVRKTYLKTQSKKNLLERMAGGKTIFDVEFNECAHNKHFLIVDDVLTTGATLENCSRAIMKIPGAKVSIVTMAMSHS